MTNTETYEITDSQLLSHGPDSSSPNFEGFSAESLRARYDITPKIGFSGIKE